MDEEIAIFLTSITRSDVSRTTAEQASSMLKLVSRIESISDSCQLIAKQIQLSQSKNAPLTQEMVNNIKHLFNMIDKVMQRIEMAFCDKPIQFSIETERKYRDDINSTIDDLNIDHLKDIKKGNYKYKVGIIYCDLFTEEGVLADHCYHALKYIDEINQSK